jgi:ATP-dependent DNA helicase RecG
MNAQELKKIITGGESETLEFKPSFNQDVIETASAFANTHGGRIVIGISNAGEVLGASFSAEEVLRDYVNRISNATEPTVIPEAERVLFPEGEVIVLGVQEYPLKPISVRGRCFKRSGSTTRQMMPSEVSEVHLQCTGQSPDALFVDGKSAGDLDLDLVRRYMIRAVNSGRRSFSVNDDPLDILRKLELVDAEDRVTRAAQLLFGKNPQSPLSQAVIHAGKLRDNVDIVDDRIIRGSLMDQVEEALDFIKKHMQVEYVIGGKLERDEIWDYPLEALREGLMNAICHRDYGDLADIQIKIFEDRLQIWSPGFLPFGMTTGELLDPNHSSKPRNRLIAQIFYDMGMIKQYGSGIGRVVDACKDLGLPAPEFDNFSGGFRILFRPKSSNTGSGLGSGLESGLESGQVTGQVTGQVGKMLPLCMETRSRKELMEALGLAGRDNFERLYLRPALERGLVAMTIPEKPNSRLQKYRLTEAGRALLANGE